MPYTQTNPSALTAGLKKYSDKFITALQPWIEAIDGFARNFSDEISSSANGGIFVPFVASNTTKQYNRTTANFKTGAPVEKNGCVVQLDSHPLNNFTITPEDIAEFNPAFWEKKAELNALDIASNIFGGIASIGSNAKVTQTHELPATLAIADIVEMAKKASSLKIKPQLATLYLTNTDYFDFLKAMNYNITGNTAIINGNLNGVLVGFQKIVCLPPEVTAGFIALPDFVCVAGRPYVGAIQGSGGEIMQETVFTESLLGVPFTQTVVRDSATKDVIHNVDCWWGAEIGNKNAGIKLTRATA